jgi:hypothetical protein
MAMMKSESNLVIEIWEQIRDALPAARRNDIAVGIIKSFCDFGFEKEDFSDIIDEDDVLTAAYNEFFNEGEEDIDYGPDEDEFSSW